MLYRSTLLVLFCLLGSPVWTGGPPAQARGSLVINEWMARNATTIRDPQGQDDDWIEILNLGTEAVDVGGMYLTDDLSDPTQWRIPSGSPSTTTLPAGGYLVIWADGDLADPGLHAGFKLDADGETIGLYDVDGTTLIDGVVFEAQAVDVSYGRYPDGSSSFRYMGAPTPGKANRDGYPGVVAGVAYSHERGLYDVPFDLEMTCPTPGAVIYYTTDGSAPVEEDRPAAGARAYGTPVPVQVTTCIRAAAVKTGWMSSPADTHTYLFHVPDAFKAMPIVSLVGDERRTFFEPDGIMAIVGGTYQGEVWQSTGPGSYNNPVHRGRAYERPVSLEVLDPSEGLCLQTDCGIRVHGSDYTRPRYTRGDDWVTCWSGWPSMNTNKFSFNLYFRDEYGDARLESALFPLIEVDRFKSIVLRGGHNDACAPFVKDEWARRLFREMGGVQVTGTFANVYLNGQYKGYYNPSSRLDQEFLQEWYKTDQEFDVINQAGVRDGTSDAWNGLLAYADSHNLANAADYDHVAARLDIPLFIDFLILEIYIANFDWPGNNWEVHRERSDTGVFRFSVWDAEGLAETWAVGSQYELTAFEDYPTWTSPRGLNHLTWDPICRLYRALKANPRFRLLFADHVHRHFRNNGILTPSRLLARWWEVFGEVAAVLPEAERYPVRFVPDQFIPNREVHVLAAFDKNGLFDQDVGAPVFQVNGAYQHGGYAETGDLLTLVNPSPSGTIYYTLDGTDPAVPGASPQQVQDVVLVAEAASKRVLVPTGAVDNAWKGGSPFNDMSWTPVSGPPGGVGFERGTGYDPYIGLDVEGRMYNKTAGCYVRVPFAVTADPAPSDLLTLRVRYDDGFVAYINGVEVQRALVDGSPQWNSVASGSHESAGLETFDLSDKRGLLRRGQNVLALHGLNVSTTSSDFVLSAELTAGHAAGAAEPRASDTGVAYTGPISLTRSVRVKARVLSGQAPSALNEAVFAVGPVKDCLRISEVMYHPLDAGDPQDPNAEFLELTNIGVAPINLSLVRFTRGIDFTFGDLILAPAAYVLVVKDQAAFAGKYPLFSGIVAGRYAGSLDNAGEGIELSDAMGQAILSFAYGDHWYDATDGDGLSLTVKDPWTTDPSAYGTKAAWQPSESPGGSPGFRGP